MPNGRRQKNSEIVFKFMENPISHGLPRPQIYPRPGFLLSRALREEGCLRLEAGEEMSMSLPAWLTTAQERFAKLSNRWDHALWCLMFLVSSDWKNPLLSKHPILPLQDRPPRGMA